MIVHDSQRFDIVFRGFTVATEMKFNLTSAILSNNFHPLPSHHRLHQATLRRSRASTTSKVGSTGMVTGRRRRAHPPLTLGAAPWISTCAQPQPRQRRQLPLQPGAGVTRAGGPTRTTVADRTAAHLICVNRDERCLRRARPHTLAAAVTTH